MNAVALLLFAAATLRITVPYALAAMGGSLGERGGVVCLALEGIMLNSALAYVLGAWYLHDPWLALLCAVSLRSEQSMIERAALFLQPRAPDFIRSYCRKLTALWCAVFAGTAGAIVWLVLAEAHAPRRAFSSFGLWLPMIVLTAVEYFVRKIWFRYYSGGPFDRLLAALLPAENTERGRRSLAYIREARAQMRAEGFTPPGELSSR